VPSELLPERVTKWVCEAPRPSSTSAFPVVMLISSIKLSLTGKSPNMASVRMNVS